MQDLLVAMVAVLRAIKIFIWLV